MVDWVVVGMHRLRRVIDAEAQDLVGAVGDHFVGIHVGGGPCPTLDHIYDEMFMVFSSQDFVTGRADGYHLFLGQNAQLAVCLRSAFLDKGQGINEVFEIAQR